jgi:hypothetical protein
MKKVILLVSLVAGIGLCSKAQTPQTTAPASTAPAAAPANNDQSAQQQQPATHGHKSQKENSLGLSNDQQQKMQQIKNDSKAKKQAIENDKTLSDSEKQAKLQSLKKETGKQKKGILTSDQRAKQKQMKSAKKANHRSSSNTEPAQK